MLLTLKFSLTRLCQRCHGLFSTVHRNSLQHRTRRINIDSTRSVFMTLWPERFMRDHASGAEQSGKR